MAQAHPARVASRRSMQAVERKDKQAWLDLFAEDAVVEDPVGPSPLDPEGKGHRGKGALSAFWDKLIEPNRLRFEIRASYAAGREVANVGTIRITFPNGSRAVCEGVFVYKVNPEGKLVSLRAFWEYERMLAGIVAPET